MPITGSYFHILYTSLGRYSAEVTAYPPVKILDTLVIGETWLIRNSRLTEKIAKTRKGWKANIPPLFRLLRTS